MIEPVTVLIDVDQVVAGFVEGFMNEWIDRKYPSYFDGITILHFWDFRVYVPDPDKHLVDKIIMSDNFYRNLPLIPGAKEAVRDIIERGHHVFFCTAPFKRNKTCESDKKLWILEHFGSDLCDNLIITGDKTMVFGDMIIDDKPEITGHRTPVWEHIWYEQPYNMNLTGKRRVNWTNYHTLFEPAR